MANVQTAQFADEGNSLVFVLYDDDTHEIVPVSEYRAAEPVQDFTPLISGGVIPLATILWFCAPRPPAGYLLCDGSEVPRARYAQLFRAIGTTYGIGDGRSTFNLPNLVGRFCRGWGPESPLDPGRMFGTYQQSSVQTHTHTYDPVRHTHSVTDPGHFHQLTDPGHVHATVDPGHLHSVSDPGHIHTTRQFTHIGFGSAYSYLGGGAIKFGPDEGFYQRYDANINFASANMIVGTTTSNVVIYPSATGYLDETATTGVTVNTAKTNLIKTETGPGDETRPVNIALLPVIRY